MSFTLGVFKTDRPKECEIAEISEDGVVTGFAEKPESPATDLAAARFITQTVGSLEFFPKKESIGDRFLPQPTGSRFSHYPQVGWKHEGLFNKRNTHRHRHPRIV